MIVLLGIVAIGFLLGFSIFIHEFGHFLAAKFFKVPVERFAMGLGPKIWGKRIGETEYAICWIPFGGYVAMGTGDDGEVYSETSMTSSSDEGHLHQLEKESEAKANNKKPSTGMEGATGDNPLQDIEALRALPLYAKIVIFSAGVFMNYLTAIVIYGFLFLHGMETILPDDPYLGLVKPNSLLAQQGFQTEDKIIEVNGVKIKDWDEIYTQVNKAMAPFKEQDEKAELKIPILVSRVLDDDPSTTKAVALELPVTPDSFDRETMIWKDEYRYFASALSSQIRHVVFLSPARKAGLKEYDRIVSINGAPVSYFVELQDHISANIGKPTVMKVERDGEILDFTITPRINANDDQFGEIGITPKYPNVEIEQHSFPYCFVKGFQAVNRIAVIYPIMLGRIFKQGFGSVRRNMGGPLMIGGLTIERATKGWVDYFEFMAIINVILMVMNLLPIPVLDGGHIVIATIESTIRRPLPPGFVEHMFRAFIVLFIVLMVLITFEDARKFIVYFFVN
ncbi:RIP metalloprotease RseP [Candidatus Sumerlaeota bacterium]|nr:RIP metalloprotease RseP [Candidatus Sumerlaeota bacterium]